MFLYDAKPTSFKNKKIFMTLRSAALSCVYLEEALMTADLTHATTTRLAVVRADKNCTIRAIQSFIQSFIRSFVEIPN